MLENTLDRWATRLEAAAGLLCQRLDDPPSLEELAAAASVSKFHFHHIWRALTGETVSQTVLRLRIEAAQQMLSAEHASVTDTAISFGFATPQSFARAFRRQTGLTPTAFRNSADQSSRDGEAELTVQIVRRDPVLVVALRREGKPYADLNATFGEVWSWAESTGAIAGLEGIYGIPLDDPCSVPEDQLRYDACLALDVAAPTPPFTSILLAAGEYACLRHLGSYDGLEEATQRLMGEWLPDSGREPADQPVIHQFRNDPDVTLEAALITDIFLSLVPIPGAP